MILEGIVTTVSAGAEMNIAPMGPHFEPGAQDFELRPFETSTTYQNLAINPCGVLHVVDDVMLIARSAINLLLEQPPTHPATAIKGFILEDCCQWFEFKAKVIATDSPRKTLHCSIVAAGHRRPFYGFNRGKHAVLEATILATRIEFIPIEEIQSQFARLQTIVEKTGGANEFDAFALLCKYVNQTVKNRTTGSDTKCQ